jgi:hypothetical protein
MMGSMRPGLPLTVLLSLSITAGCGGDDGDEPSDSIPGGADPVAVEVIEGWSDDLRAGEVAAAADYWEIPSVAQNGTPPLELTSRDDVIAFNESLPCGAELVRAEPQGEFTVATFELTERPGAGECGPGTGETARTAFVIEDGKIVEWRRAAGELLEPPAEGPIV